MVNQDILNYLKEGKERGFDVELLKGKLIEGGFDKNEVESAFLELNNTQKERTSQFSEDKKGIKWMKIGGYAGFGMVSILGALLILLFVPNVIKSISNADSTSSNYILLGIWIIILLLWFVINFGIARMGKKIEVKILSFSAYSRIGFWVFIVVFITILFYTKIIENMAIQIMLNLMRGNENNVIEEIYKTLLIPIFGFLILGTIYFVIEILMSISMIKIRNKVKYSLTSGIANLTYLFLIIFGVVYLVYVIISALVSPSSVVNNFYVDSIGMVISLFMGLSIITLIVNLISASLSLLDASKKFE